MDRPDTDSGALDYSIDAVLRGMPERNVFKHIFPDVAAGLYAVYMRGYKHGSEDGKSKERLFRSENPVGICANCGYYNFDACTNTVVRGVIGYFKPPNDFGCNQHKERK